MRLYLASASPRRLELLRRAGWNPLVVAQSADETPLDGELPEATVRRLAVAKAASARAGPDAGAQAGLVLAADTEVVSGDRILGKPKDDDDARAMLAGLAGRTHRVITGVAWESVDGAQRGARVETTEVAFHDVGAAAIDAYVATGSPRDKAGAYGLQDLDESWIAAVRGLRSNVIGLPVERLRAWIGGALPAPQSPDVSGS